MARFVVFAAGSGIGQAVVAQLRDAGHTVVTTARNDSRITPDIIVEATDFVAVDDAMRLAKERMGGIDGVVNCAGSLLLKPAHLTSQAEFQATIDASLTTAFAVVRAAGKHMTDGGAVVLVSSAAARTGLANHEAIAAAKAGVIGLTLSAAATYAPQNLRINAVAPGLTDTPLTAGLMANEMSRKYSQAMHALGRLGHAEDVARAIVFLLDPDNSWVTGQVIGVDGGLSSVRPKAKA